MFKDEAKKTYHHPTPIQASPNVVTSSDEETIFIPLRGRD